jgi:hypothetical protein
MSLKLEHCASRIDPPPPLQGCRNRLPRWRPGWRGRLWPRAHRRSLSSAGFRHQGCDIGAGDNTEAYVSRAPRFGLDAVPCRFESPIGVTRRVQRISAETGYLLLSCAAVVRSARSFVLANAPSRIRPRPMPSRPMQTRLNESTTVRNSAGPSRNLGQLIRRCAFDAVGGA